jgi:L-rhamnose mutarotase
VSSNSDRRSWKNTRNCTPTSGRRCSCHIHNYSIYFKDGYLFSYFEYDGDDFAADMQKMAADPNTQAWWKLTDPCQEPLETRKPGEWWASMEEFFHAD